MIKADANNPLLDRLEPGEHLLWSGKPNKGVYLLHDMYLLVMPLIGVIYIAIVVIQLLVFRNSGLPTLLYLAIGLSPLLILAFIFARVWMTARTATNTHYALTDRRILIQSGLFARQEVSIPLVVLPDLQLSQQGTDCGTIIFAPVGPFQRLIGGSWFVGGVAFARRISGGSTRPPAFVAINRATEVYNLAATARWQAQQEQQSSQSRLLTNSSYSF